MAKNIEMQYYTGSAYEICYPKVLLTNVAGTLEVANGGTGKTTLTSGYALIGNGTSAVNLRAIDTTSGGTSGSASLITSGAVYSKISSMETRLSEVEEMTGYISYTCNLTFRNTVTSATWSGGSTYSTISNVEYNIPTLPFSASMANIEVIQDDFPDNYTYSTSILKKTITGATLTPSGSTCIYDLAQYDSGSRLDRYITYTIGLNSTGSEITVIVKQPSNLWLFYPNGIGSGVFTLKFGITIFP